MADALLEALNLHRAGRLDEAEALYRSILAATPNNADCLNLLGAVALQRGDHQRALDFIQCAIAVRTDRPAYYCNLAAACRGLGRFDEAIEASKSALAIQPDLPDAYLNLGLAHQGAQHWLDAEQAFRHLAQQWPRSPRGPELLGDCYAAQGRKAEAYAAYREALARDPDDAPVHLVLGTMLVTNGEPAAAEHHLRRAVELLPHLISARINFGSCLTHLGRENEALHVYDQALQMDPANQNVWLCIGQAYVRCSQYVEAEKWFNAVLAADPNNAGASCGLGDVRREMQQPREAIPLYEQALRIDPKFSAYKGLADAHSDCGDYARAQDVLHDAVVRFPADPEAHIRYASALGTAGDFEQAVAECRSALRIRPDYIEAWTQLAQILGKRLPEEERNAAESLLQQTSSTELDAGLHFALAHVADARGEFDRAAGHARQGNAIAKAYLEAHGRAHDPAASRRYADRLLAAYTPGCFARTAGFGLETDQPVFIVGMPRSGTTLVEQILASHPAVFGAGECRFAHETLRRLPGELGLNLDPLDCIGRLTKSCVQNSAGWYLEQVRRLDRKGARRIVDKMPQNYRLLGLLQIYFPNAKFIHCRRDLRDVALSCWLTNFQNYSWSYDLHHIAAEIQDYERIMAHWQAVLPRPVLEVRYEQLVAGQEAESRKLIEWLGLVWDPACLSFHATRRPVRTASVSQVRQPIYSRSAGRWRNYIDVLRPLIEELGRGYE